MRTCNNKLCYSHAYARGSETSASMKKVMQMVILEIPFVIHYYFMVHVPLTQIQAYFSWKPEVRLNTDVHSCSIQIINIDWLYFTHVLLRPVTWFQITKFPSGMVPLKCWWQRNVSESVKFREGDPFIFSEFRKAGKSVKYRLQCNAIQCYQQSSTKASKTR